MSAELVGLDKVLKYCASYEFQKLKLSRGTDTIYLARAKEGENEQNLLDNLNEWVEEFITSDNFKEYKLELFGTYKENKGGALAPIVKITVSFNDKPNGLVSRNSEPMGSMINNNKNSIDIGAYVEAMTQNARLEAKLEQMEQRLNDMEDEEDEEAAVGNVAPELNPQQVLIAAIAKKADLIVDAAIGRLFPTPPPQNYAVAGANDALGYAEIIKRFEVINPQFKSDFIRLLTLAETQPDTYNFLVNNLRSMV
tara:strand:+ start:5151 stop:5909 length:759 start_codon:yes stop_codon:yes gene_type:complete